MRAMCWMAVACLGACDTSEPASGPCVDETRAQALEVGTQGVGDLQATLQAGAPLPAEVGPNEWTVDLVGTEGCEVTVTPFMPDHNHGTTEPATITASTGGSYVLEMDLIMGGFWTVTIEASCDEHDPVEAVFSICAET